MSTPTIAGQVSVSMKFMQMPNKYPIAGGACRSRVTKKLSRKFKSPVDAEKHFEEQPSDGTPTVLPPLLQLILFLSS